MVFLALYWASRLASHTNANILLNRAGIYRAPLPVCPVDTGNINSLTYTWYYVRVLSKADSAYRGRYKTAGHGMGMIAYVWYLDTLASLYLAAWTRNMGNMGNDHDSMVEFEFEFEFSTSKANKSIRSKQRATYLLIRILIHIHVLDGDTNIHAIKSRPQRPDGAVG